MRRVLLLLLFLAIAPLSFGDEHAFPKPQGRVNDFADALGEDARKTLAESIEAFERETGAEFAVVTVDSLDGLPIEDYAVGLFKSWGIGKKSADNGVLLLICPPEHKLRIEVGYGLEGVLPDGLAGAIIREQLTPKFRAGDLAGGTVDGAQRIMDVVRAKHELSPEERRALEEQAASADDPPAWITTPFFGLFILLGSASIGMGLRQRSGFPLLWGSGFGGIPLLMALIPSFNVMLWLLLPLAGLVFAIAFLKAPSISKTFSSRGRSGSGSSSGSSSWSSSSSDSSWSSSSSSDFGGGSSGGGGASGSW